MTEPTATVTSAIPGSPPATLETLAAWAKEVQSSFMERYKRYLGASPAPTRKAVLRIQLETVDESLRKVQNVLNHGYRSARMAAALRAALDAGTPAALAAIRDPVSGRPTAYTSSTTAAQHARELELVVRQIRTDTPARLEKMRTALLEIDAVLADTAGTPEDAIAHIAVLEEQMAASNAQWQARVTALEARFDQVATGTAPPPTRKTPARKTPTRKKTTRKKPPAKKSGTT